MQQLKSSWKTTFIILLLLPEHSNTVRHTHVEYQHTPPDKISYVKYPDIHFNVIKHTWYFLKELLETQN